MKLKKALVRRRAHRGAVYLISAFPKNGANGGAQADAGSYHVEVVPKGAVLHVFLRDHNDKDVKSEGFKGTAIFVVGGKSHRILLTPAGENRLSGTASVDLPAEPKGAVQITTPSGSDRAGEVLILRYL